MNDRIIMLIPAKMKEGPTENRPFRVVAYCRISSPSEEQERSLETQKWYYNNKIENHSLWESAGIFADTATGRNLKQRVGFKKLLAKCRVSKVDLIITKSISRFGRNSLETIKALREQKSNNIDVYFEQENIHLLDPTAGKAVWNRGCIRKMLYASAVLLQKTYVEDFFTGKKKKNVGQKQKYYYKNNHKAIMPLELFLMVQGI